MLIYVEYYICGYTASLDYRLSMGVHISNNRLIQTLVKSLRLSANFLNAKYKNVKSIMKNMCMCHYLYLSFKIMVKELQ